MSRSNQYRVTVSVDGTDLGVWDAMSGGAATSEDVKYRPGGLAPQVALGGSQTVDNVTVSRLYDLSRDHSIVHWLMTRRGRGTAVVTKQPLDVDGNAFGRPLVYQGKVLTVTPPEVDSESDDVAKIEMEVSTNGSVG